MQAKAFNPPLRFLIFGVKRSKGFVLRSLISTARFDKPHGAPSETMAYKETRSIVFEYINSNCIEKLFVMYILGLQGWSVYTPHPESLNSTKINLKQYT